MRRQSLWVIAACTFYLFTEVHAGDWPQYRYDAGRTAATSESLATNLHLQWVREAPAPRPAFPGEVRLRYDATYEPVVAGQTVFVPSMVTDSVTALDTATGEERWQFVAEGPVRFAPAVLEGRVYFVSDDGYLYCVGADDGKLLWRFRGAPDDKRERKVMGNGRLVSLFPARGGPVLADGIVYFAAGIWSGEGVFVHALDAKSGDVVWSNVDSDRIAAANMDHGVAQYGGISPQGYLAVVDDKLVVPCGAHLPAVLDLKTGELGAYTMGWGGRVGLAKGTWFVAGVGKYLMHAGDLYDIRRPNDERFGAAGGSDYKRMLYLAGLTRLRIDPTNQKPLGQFRRPVVTPQAMYFNDRGIVACDLTKDQVEERATADVPPHRKDDHAPDRLRGVFPELWRLPSKSMVHLKAGARLYCGREKVVEAIDIPAPGEEARISWRAEIQGTPRTMLAADEKLFVVTIEGRIYAFGQEQQSEPVTHAQPSASPSEPDEWTERARDILKTAGTSDGYALVLGIGSGRLIEELVHQSRCDVIAVDEDARKIANLRQKFCRAGLNGSRVTLLVGDPTSYPYPPYFASLMVTENRAALGDDFDRRFADALVHCLRPYGGTACLTLPAAERGKLVAAVSGAELAGVTALEAGDSVIVTRKGPLPESSDWSHNGANAANTGASRDRFVKAPLSRLWFDGSFRWIKAPGATIVRVAGGRVFIGAGNLQAIDVYTGRHLWQVATPPARPSEDGMVVVEDAIYLASGKSCAVLNPANGEKIGEINLPSDIGAPWSIIRVTGDRLVGACGNTVVCINRGSGSLVWKRDRESKIGCLALGADKVFCADFVAKRPGEKPPEVGVEALDLRTGKVLWQAKGGGEIRYSEPCDLLCSSSGVFRGEDGTRVSDTAVSLVVDDKLICGAPDQVVVLDARTGAKIGEQLKWNRRGCTILRGSSNLLTTRYLGNASYIDLATRQITSIWNVRAACSNNLFVANGVLNAPGLTLGCTCNYLPISQALVPSTVVDRLAGALEKRAQ